LSPCQRDRERGRGQLDRSGSTHPTLMRCNATEIFNRHLNVSACIPAADATTVLTRASPAGRGRRRDPHLGGASATPPFAGASAVGFPTRLAAGTDLRAAGRGSAPAPAASAGSSSPSPEQGWRDGDLGEEWCKLEEGGLCGFSLTHLASLMDRRIYLWEREGMRGRTSRLG
jgi:hypothetical protein